MKVFHAYDESCAYPGHYVPLFNAESVRRELRHPHEGKMQNPPLNITERPDIYLVEIAIPGLKHEDFLITAEAHFLTVAVLQNTDHNSNCRFQLHEYNYQCFQRHILLPDDADAEFSTAKYAEGLLQIFVPRTDQPLMNFYTRIAVY